jgi:hypothetical protein
MLTEPESTVNLPDVRKSVLVPLVVEAKLSTPAPVDFTQILLTVKLSPAPPAKTTDAVPAVSKTASSPCCQATSPGQIPSSLIFQAVPPLAAQRRVPDSHLPSPYQYRSAANPACDRATVRAIERAREVLFIGVFGLINGTKRMFLRYSTGPQHSAMRGD